MAETDKLTRPPLERMLVIHRQLQSGKYPNCATMARELEVSTKTIQRDLDFMRDRLALPIAYNTTRFGYHYTEEVGNFPGIEISEGEIVALLVAQKALLQYQGTTYEKPLRAAFGKISEGLRDKISFGWQEVESGVSFRSPGQSVSDLERFEIVSKAVLRSEEVEFDYKKLKSNKYETRLVQPWHLGCVENQWYLFGLDQGRKQIRTFALPRMRKVKLTKRKFLRPANFSISDHLSGSFGVFSGKEKHRVVLEFDAFAGRLASERMWHESQKVEELENGILLTMNLGSLEEVERWILSWGAHVKVLEPKELAGRIQTVASEICNLYA